METFEQTAAKAQELLKEISDTLDRSDATLDLILSHLNINPEAI
jgi:hypothetical protein